MTRATFIVIVCSVVLWFCLCQINHYLTPLHVSVFAGGLLVAFPALRLGFREGWWSTLCIGLLIDSSSAVYFGFHALLFLLLHVVIFHYRDRFPREETPFGVIVALFANFLLFLGITVSLLHRTPAPFSAVGRLTVDLLASEGLVLAIGPWFFSLQERALEWGGVSLRREQRGLL